MIKASSKISSTDKNKGTVLLSRKEVTDLGAKISLLASETSKSLSMMSGEEYTYSFIGISEFKPEYIDELVQASAGEICAVYVRAEGDITVGMMLFLAHEQAGRLAHRLLGSSDPAELNKLGRSSIAEVGNILLAGSLVNNMSRHTGFKMNCSVPGLAIDNIHGVIEFPINDISSVDEKSIIAESKLIGKQSNTTIRILIVIGASDARKLHSSMKNDDKRSLNEGEH
jgi:chemotaxis protein CheY-P-specific phosphatase CheC